MDDIKKLKCMGTDRDCKGSECAQYMKFFSVDKDDKATEFWKCAFVQTPLLLIELIQTIVNKK